MMDFLLDNRIACNEKNIESLFSRYEELKKIIIEFNKEIEKLKEGRK